MVEKLTTEPDQHSNMECAEGLRAPLQANWMTWAEGLQWGRALVFTLSHSLGFQHRVSSAIVSYDVNSIRGLHRLGHAPQVHVNMYDNDPGAMTLRALGLQFSCAGRRRPSWTLTRRSNRTVTSVISVGAAHGASCVSLEETHRMVH